MKKLVLAAASVLATLSLSCAEDEPNADWYGDVRFTPEEREEIQNGIRWLYGAAGLPPPTFRWNTVMAGNSSLPKEIRREPGPGAAGQCVQGAIYLAVDGDPRFGEAPVRPDVLPGWAAHEAAHCRLGFADGYHRDDVWTNGIMRVLVPMRWTEAEQRQCEARADLCPNGRPDAGPRVFGY